MGEARSKLAFLVVNVYVAGLPYYFHCSSEVVQQSSEKRTQATSNSGG